MMLAGDRRGRLDEAIVEMAADSVFTPVVTRLGCLRGVVHVDRVRVGRRNWGLAATERALDRRVPRVGAHRVLLGGYRSPGRGHQDRQRPAPPPAGRSGLASPAPVPARAGAAEAVGDGVPGGPCTRPGGQPASEHPLGGFSFDPHARNGPWSPTRRSRVNWPAGAGRWPSSTTNTHECPENNSVVTASVWE